MNSTDGIAMRLAADTTWQPSRWPRIPADLDVWVPYAIETVANTERDVLDYDFTVAIGLSGQGLALRDHVRAGVARNSGRLLALLPFPTLRRNTAGAWMEPNAAVRILIETQIVATFEDLARLLDIFDGINRIDGFMLVRVSMEQVLTVHAAGFEVAAVVREAERNSGIVDLCRWVEAGFTGKEWDLVQRAGLNEAEVDDVIVTGRFPEENALEMLAAFHHVPEESTQATPMEPPPRS